MTFTDPGHRLVEEFWGTPTAAAVRSVDVLNAQAAALAWARRMAGTYPAPRIVADRLAAVATRMRTGEDDRDPRTVLMDIARSALAEHRAGAV
jgi:hypothetical protein